SLVTNLEVFEERDADSAVRGRASPAAPADGRRCRSRARRGVQLRVAGSPRSGERVRGAGDRRATDRFAVPPGAGEGPAGPGVGRTRSRWPAPGAHGACATMSRPAHAWWTFIWRPAGQHAARQHAPPRPRADAARISAPSAGTPRAPADGAPD